MALKEERSINVFGPAFTAAGLTGKAASGMLSQLFAPQEAPILGQTGNKDIDTYHRKALLEAKKEAESKFPDDPEKRKAFIAKYLEGNFRGDKEFRGVDFSKLPEWVAIVGAKGPEDYRPSAPEMKEVTEVETPASEPVIEPSPGMSGVSPEEVMPDPFAFANLNKIPVSAPSTAPSPVTKPEPIIAPAPKPAQAPSAYAPAYMATAPAEPVKESTHPWLEGVNQSPSPQAAVAKPMQKAYSNPVKQFGSAQGAFKAAPYAKEVSKVEGMGYVPKAVPLSVGEEVAENTRKIKADIAKKGLGSESDVEEGDMAKPVRVTNPYATSQYKFNNP
jgi:hypothetical protein